MRGVTTELKVGIFALIVVGILALMTFRVGDFTLLMKKGYSVYINFDNVAGLDKKTKVKIAGVDAGVIEDITLKNGIARLKVRLDTDKRLYSDASAAIKATGFLGDKFLAINIGSKEPVLKNGDTVKTVTEVVDIDDMSRNFSEVSANVNKLVTSLNDSMGSEEAKQALKESIVNLRHITSNINSAVIANDGRLRDVLGSINDMTAAIKDLVQSNKDQVASTVKNFRDFSEPLKSEGPELIANLNKATKDLREIVEENKASVRGAIESVENITKKIDRGEGTIGKLVKDEKLYESLNRAVEGINRTVSAIDRFKTFITFQGEYLNKSKEGKGYFYMTLQPRPEKYYILGIVGDPIGRSITTDTTTTVNGVTTVEKKEEVQKKIEFTAQFARRFPESPVFKDTVLRAGLTENTFGIGMDQFFLKDRLKLSIDAWDFERNESGAANPHIRLGADYFIFKNLFVTGGIDNILNSKQRGLYGGGGVRFEDEDFKYVVGAMPKITP